jgi:hypothetical protein
LASLLIQMAVTLGGSDSWRGLTKTMCYYLAVEPF